MSSCLRVAICLLPVLLAGMALFSSSPMALAPRPHCESCRRFLDVSPGLCRVRIEGEKRTKTIEACSLFCLFELLEKNRLKGEQRISVLDHTTLESDQQTMMLSRQATCLYEPEADDELTHEPVVFYFFSEEEAKAAQKIHGGEIRSYEDVAEECFELAEEFEQKSGSGYKPLRIRPRGQKEKSDESDD